MNRPFVLGRLRKPMVTLVEDSNVSAPQTGLFYDNYSTVTLVEQGFAQRSWKQTYGGKNWTTLKVLNTS
jgi:hypothetical protein